MQITATLIIATYQMPKHLELVLAAVARQSVKNFEVILCDDGSDLQTRTIISQFATVSNLPVLHLWQENKGFRKCRILNRALTQARGETLIFLDGDCVPHQKFVEDHIQQQEEGVYLAGRRVELGPQFSEQLTPALISRGFLDSPSLALYRSVKSGDSEHFQRSFRIPVLGIRKLLGMTKIDDLKGCNYSVQKKHLLAINGFDEAYEGYGREDTDVEIRLQNLGLKIKSLKGLALQYHVWHPRREFTPANEDLLIRARTQKIIRCSLGIEKV